MQYNEVKISYHPHYDPNTLPKITSSKHLHEALMQMFNLDTIAMVEEVILLCLNNTNQIIAWKSISTGGSNRAIIEPKMVFQIALLANATNIILAHNHPSGNLTPSSADRDMCRQIQKAGEVLNITLLDNIIVTFNKGYCSFVDEGLL